VIRACARCGRGYSSKLAGRRYCSDECRDTARREYLRDYWRTHSEQANARPSRQGRPSGWPLWMARYPERYRELSAQAHTRRALGALPEQAMRAVLRAERKAQPRRRPRREPKTHCRNGHALGADRRTCYECRKPLTKCHRGHDLTVPGARNKRGQCMECRRIDKRLAYRRRREAAA
jgi:hypothetical protein